MISICEKMRLQLLRKAKYSILASMFHIYLFFFLQRLIPTRKIQCKSHGFLTYYFESRNIFQKCDFLQKFSLSLIFFFF